MSSAENFTLLGLGVIAMMAVAGVLAFGLWTVIDALMGKGDA